jgi:predicted nuclease with RNAse H fold
VRALGIDVGVRKGLDLVVLEHSLLPRETHRGVGLAALGDRIGEIGADVVAVDGPPAWAARGRSRQAERELLRLGIRSYATPTAARGTSHPFYGWMRMAIEVFAVARRVGYPLGGSHPVIGHAIEAFAHASAVVLAGILPPPGIAKSRWRRGILEAAGVSAESLRSPDQVDAALAALTGLAALGGRSVTVGDPHEGLIVLPAPELPVGPFARRAA